MSESDDKLKLYDIQVTIYHSVQVEAYSDEEAEELAMDKVQDERMWWDDVDLYIENVEDLED